MFAEALPSRSPLFDADHLARYTGGDADLQTELLTLMCEQADRCLSMMQHATDRTTWRAATHTLKGSARGVGAFALADVCEDAEEMPPSAWEGARLAIAGKFAATREVLPGLA